MQSWTRRGKRAISTSKLAVVVLVVVVIVVGAAVILSMNRQQSTNYSSESTTKPVNTSVSNSCQYYGGTLTIDVVNDKGPPGDPMMVQEGAETGTVQTAVYEGLTAINFQGQVVPDLATNWTQVTPTEYIFSLRHDVKFQDGTPFNASAVVFSFERILHDKSSPRYGQVSIIENVTEINNYKVEFQLTEPDSDFLASLAVGEGIVSPSAVEKYGSQFGSEYAVGTGPYDFVKWVQNQEVVLQANPDYWGGTPCVSKLVIQIVPNPTTRLLQLESGQAQLVELTPQLAKSVANQSNIKVLEGPANEFITLSINMNPNTTIEPLLNPLVREAINYAINRTAIVQNVLDGYAVPGIGPIPPGVQECWNPSLAVYPPNGNITKAKQLLAEAGYPHGFDVSILTAPFTNQYLQDTEAIASDLSQVGINATIDQQSFSVAAGTLLSGNGTWELAYHNWGGTGLPTPYSYVGEFYNENDIGYFEWNLQHIVDPNLTKMINELGQTTNVTQITSLCNSIQSRILSQGYGVILYYPYVLQGQAQDISGYKIHPVPWYGFVIFSPVIGAYTSIQQSSPASSSAFILAYPAPFLVSEGKKLFWQNCFAQG